MSVGTKVTDRSCKKAVCGSVRNGRLVAHGQGSLWPSLVAPILRSTGPRRWEYLPRLPRRCVPTRLARSGGDLVVGVSESATLSL